MSHLQDQMIIFLALAKGRSTVATGPLTLHTRSVSRTLSGFTAKTNFVVRTAIWVAEQLTDAKFEVHEEIDSRVLIQCDGIGYAPPEGDLSADDGTDEPNAHD